MGDFLICLFLGVFGVHKFKEKKFLMGVLYLFTFGLFGFGWVYDCVKYLLPVIKVASVAVLPEGQPLPVVRSNGVMLGSGETCHYSKPATFVKTKHVVLGQSSTHSGTSIRVAKGMSFRMGESHSKTIRGNVQEKTAGILTVTNKRIIFSASKGAFDKSISSLSSITPYKDGIGFQFGSQQFPLMTADAPYIYQIVSKVVNDSNEIA